MTIILAPDTEARLREKAAREGRDPAALAELLLADLLDNEEAEHAVVIDAVSHALLSAEAGREKTLSAYVTQQREKRGYSPEWPYRNSVTESAPGMFDTASE